MEGHLPAGHNPRVLRLARWARAQWSAEARRAGDSLESGEVHSSAERGGRQREGAARMRSRPAGESRAVAGGRGCRGAAEPGSGQGGRDAVTRGVRFRMRKTSGEARGQGAPRRGSVPQASRRRSGHLGSSPALWPGPRHPRAAGPSPMSPDQPPPPPPPPPEEPRAGYTCSTPVPSLGLWPPVTPGRAHPYSACSHDLP